MTGWLGCLWQRLRNWRTAVDEPFDLDFPDGAPAVPHGLDCPDTEPTSPGALDSDLARLQ